MFKYLQLKRSDPKVAPDPENFSINQIIDNADAPVAIRHLNNLPDNAKRRLYRSMLPAELLRRFEIKPITWKGPAGDSHVRLDAPAGTGKVSLSVYRHPDDLSPFICIELADNSFNGIDLNLLLLNDPASPYFRTDIDAEEHPTYFGTVRRNLVEEARAKSAGLAPGQVRASLGGSALVLQYIEVFLTMLAHQAYYLEPLSYTSAWVFERRGFAYVRGHKLMDDIHREFQPGGKLNAALDGSTPFRQPEQWNTVRGRAWAIQDGILDVLDARWDKLRMVKQIGQQAGVNTFPGAVY